MSLLSCEEEGSGVTTLPTTSEAVGVEEEAYDAWAGAGTHTC